MEITFENGKTLTKAITVSLLEDGTFFAKFDDYEITAEDSFIDRPDSEAIGAAPVIEDNYKEADPNEPEQIVIPNSITFTGTIIDNVIESLVPIILVDVEENSGLSYDKVLFELTEEQKDWELKIGTRVQIVCSDIFQESTPPIGNLISITEAAPNDELKIADEAARAYADQQHSRSATLSSDLLLSDATDGGGHDLRRSQDAAVRGRSDLCAANCARIKELYAHDRGSDSISGRTVGGTGSKVIPNFESDDIKGG